MSAKRILWPTDFSPAALEALDAASELSRAFDGELLLLHVIEDPGEEASGEPNREGTDVAGWSLWRIAKERIEEKLRTLAEDRALPAGSFRVLAAFGDPAEKIAETVREEGIDTVVLSARREKAFLAQRLLGTVAYRVVRTVPCDVLIVK
jgi:nucleotide-binding universal stress UspA family protein